jgi:hypothetical protein
MTQTQNYIYIRVYGIGKIHFDIAHQIMMRHW